MWLDVINSQCFSMCHGCEIVNFTLYMCFVTHTSWLSLAVVTLVLTLHVKYKGDYEKSTNWDQPGLEI